MMLYARIDVRKKISRILCYLLVVLMLLSPTFYLYVINIKPLLVQKKSFEARLYANKIYENSTVLPGTYRPKIVIWAKQYHPIGWTFPDIPGDHGGCDVTWDRNEYPISDAVVFYMKSCKSSDLPERKERSRFQVFIWWAHESPWTVLNYYQHTLKDFDNYFNWTMTYRRDSDVLASFAPTPAMDYILHKFGRTNEIRDKDLLTHPTITPDEFKQQTNKLMSGKSKLIAWIASDCDFTNGASKRLNFVNKMSENDLLKIDRFGKCGTKRIAMNYTVLFQTLAPYKFYIAFENSFLCNDYITEKSLYNGLVGATVPIILGPSKDDAAKILPTNSFIHMDDFENVNELAKYLKYLDNNNDDYLKYFEWWKEPGAHVIPRFGYNYGSGNVSKFNKGHKWTDAIQDDMMEIERFGMYHLCNKLRNMDHIRKTKTISKLYDVWYGTEEKQCYKK